MLRGAIKIAIVAIVVYKLVQTVLKPSADTHYKKHYPGECRQVAGIDFGSEDFEVTKSGWAFITSGVWFPTMSTAYSDFLEANNIKGSIYLYDFNKPGLGARKLKLNPSKNFNLETFHPHGISLLEDEVKGEHLLYVINHPDNNEDAIEKFRYSPKTDELIHIKSFSSDKLQITNDLAVVDEDKFYITNYLYYRNYYLSFLERYALNNLGTVVFFDGNNFNVVVKGLNSPNGVFLSKNKRNLYLNVPRSSSLIVYEVKNDNSLVKIQEVNLHTGADNLHLSQTADALYTGAHSGIRKIIQHLRDPRLIAPSSVLHIPLKKGKVVAEDITELFYDHGDLISGSSVATVYNNKLLIGSIINKLVICDVNSKI